MAPTPTYLRRTLAPLLDRVAAEFPVVVLTGPRQSGKTTLRGGFPELWAECERDAARWHSSGLQTYLERDVRQLR
jgi:predicted AAA+ superfamily ATPase